MRFSGAGHCEISTFRNAQNEAAQRHGIHQRRQHRDAAGRPGSSSVGGSARRCACRDPGAGRGAGCLVERWPSLGGVCLNVGCIPSKALLHAAKVVSETEEMGAHGISFTSPAIDLDKLRDWKDGVVKRLTGGLSGLARQRKVTVVEGTGRFISLNQVEVLS